MFQIKGLKGKLFLNTVVLLVISLLILSVSIFFLYFLAEKYFFDKFFYYKSVDHGYWVFDEDKQLTVSFRDFGERALYYRQLRHGADVEDLLPNHLSDEELFTIAIIGDSYTWGQGVRWPQTFSQVLEKKLQKDFNVRVMTVANCGDIIVDYLVDYRKLEEIYSPDFYVFALVVNDLAPHISSYEDLKQEPIIRFCEDNFPEEEANIERNSDIDYLNDKELFDPFVLGNPINECFVSESIKQLPTEQSIYLLTESYFEWAQERLDFFREILELEEKTIIDSKEILNLPQYERYLKDYEQANYSSLVVSKKDGHPSALVHQLYADLLYEAIVPKIPSVYHK
jgi:hypothetical protein